MESTCNAVYMSPHKYTMREENICLKVLVTEIQIATSSRFPAKLKLTNFLPQQVKIGATFFSSYFEILRNVLQGSILGPISFNLFINDFMFFIKKTEVCNFPDDTTIYSCSLNYEEAPRKLSADTHIIPNWFRINSMVANLGKFQVIYIRSSINNKNIFMVENKHKKQ